MKIINKSEDSENISWHDNSLYGISWKVEFESGVSDLILDIDYICDWICNKDKTCRFKVSPADLIFHNITDLKISIDWGDSGFQACNDGGLPILDITKEIIKNQKVHLDRQYYKWTIKFAPSVKIKDSFISFGATGFTQTLRKEPILIDRQALTLNERK